MRVSPSSGKLVFFLALLAVVATSLYFVRRFQGNKPKPRSSLSSGTIDRPMLERPRVAPVEARDDSSFQSRRLTEDDIARFRPLLFAVLDNLRQLRARELLEDELRAFELERGFSALIDSPAWGCMLEAHHLAAIADNRVTGAGRIMSKVALISVKGELFAYPYQYCLPRDYDHHRSWPVLLCIPDKGCDAATYLKEVWLDTTEYRDLCDDFILVAPDLRQTTLGEEFREGRSVEKLISWFDVNFLRSILMPLVEIRRNHHCNPERIFIEGVGEGADAATELAAIAPGRFAGVINRHGSLRDLNVLKGLEGNKVLMVGRAGGAFYDDRGKASGLLAALEKSRAEQGAVEFELAESPAVDRITSMMMAKQDVDPVIEGNAAIADFVAKNALNPYPVTLRLVSPVTGAFKSHPLVKVTSADSENAENYIDLRLTFDRAENRIAVHADRVFGFSVFLNDELLDLDRPIEVIINGVTLDSRLAERNLDMIIGHMVENPLDSHRIVTAHLRFEVPY